MSAYCSVAAGLGFVRCRGGKRARNDPKNDADHLVTERSHGGACLLDRTYTLGQAGNGERPIRAGRCAVAYAPVGLNFAGHGDKLWNTRPLAMADSDERDLVVQ